MGGTQQRAQGPRRENKQWGKQQCGNHGEQQRRLGTRLCRPKRLVVITIAYAVIVRVLMRWIVISGVMVLVLKEPACGF